MQTFASDPIESPPLIRTTQPLLNCDLVMKGGITSGAVYPKAVVRIAQRYRIRSIGGTSVGALAAALTAAAEFWRQNNPGDEAEQRARINDVVSAMSNCNWKSTDPRVQTAERDLIGDANDNRLRGFAGLYRIPEEIGRDLPRMFQPSQRTRGLYSYVVGILNRKSTSGKILAAVWRQFYVVRALVGILFGLMALALQDKPHLGLWVTALALVVVALLMLASTLLDETVNETIKALPPKVKKTLPAALALITLAGMFLLIELGLGWGRVLDWITDQAGAHPIWTAGVIVAALFAEVWPRVKQALLPTGQDDRKRKTADLIDGYMVLAAIAGFVIVVWNTWGWISSNRDDVGTTAVGVGIGWVVGGGVALLYYLLVELPKNFNGICTGIGTPIALTNWLTHKIDELAGIEGTHLTFAMLKKHKIEFEAITSDLTRGVPLDVPRALIRYQFCPKEFSRLFPASVVEQLGVAKQDLMVETLKEFPPDWESVPVVVAARMSLSFPVLFSAIPVYFAGLPDEEMNGPPTRNMLSDGGIVSNFPLHKFDRALPPWPTFAIDLVDQRAGPPTDVSKQVWINPIRNRVNVNQSIQSHPKFVKESQPEIDTGDLVGFAARILATARGWMDNSQKTLPGYAERIVAIYLYPGEGGLNLNMESSIIKLLADRGMCGADMLLKAWEPFDANGQSVSGNQWDQHRWLRYKILMRELEQIGREWRWIYAPASASLTPVHDPPFADLVKQMPAGEKWQDRLAFRWESDVFAAGGKGLTDLFAGFSSSAGAGVNMTAETPADAGLDPQIFDQELKPSVHPKRFSVPPFE